MVMLFLLAIAFMQQPPSAGIVTIAQGEQSAIQEAAEATARTPAEWQALWKRHGATDMAPTVDFAKEMVVAVFLGMRRTGGYTVDVRATRREGTMLVVDYVEQAPGGDLIVTQALTSPFHIVRVPRYDGAVQFRRVPSGTAR